MFRLWLGAGVVASVALLALHPWSRGASISISVRPVELAADGYSEASITIQSPNKPSLTSPNHKLHVGKLRQTGDNTWTAVVRAGVTPGVAKVVANSAAGQVATGVTLQPFSVDREDNGMPDAVELDSEQDQRAFRSWFAFLAEAQFFQRVAARPAEINDCAALIRYAYREALKEHDEVWAKDAKLPLIRAIPAVEKYNYPYTLLGPSLFRVKEDGFSQFADAQTLQRFNTRLISRDVARALPGDLLFYRHDKADLPFHGMIYIGPSQVQGESEDRFLVYHTGPDGHDPGEIRRPTLAELLRHPNPEWRPVPGNPTFLGVFRWNILP